MNKNIFHYSDYKSYLKAIETTKEIKGFRSRVAEVTSCQNAFISQVLNGEVNFNLEQALKISDFLNHTPDERQFFLWMIEHKRAGTQELKKYFSVLMTEIAERNLVLKNRINAPQTLSQEDQARYYSAWIYSAIHIATMVRGLNSVSKIAEALNISDELCSKAVDFLVRCGLLEKNGGSIRCGKNQIHLGKDSANISKHHSNWRIEAIKSLDKVKSNEVHYSGVSCLSKADANIIRTQLIDYIENYVKQVESSKEETVFALGIDFFSVLKD